ncbi:Bax inhibitor-1/YccA family protein, partial [Saprospiraceae bacterium]|nr:Bax inhibitor-1/YccA family protein [Saprospiraceae bacterium]
NSSGLIVEGDVMTVNGAVNKTLLLFSMMMATTSIAWFMPSTFLLYVGAGGGLVVLIAAAFKPHLAPFLAPLYALLEGLAIGTISVMYATAFEGIVLQAVGLTFGTLFMMLAIYKSGLIKVTEKFRMGVAMATGAIMILYLFGWIGQIFGFEVAMLHDSGMFGIGISAVIIVVASMNLLLDFDMFERGEKQGAPIYMEWFAAMGLIVTLVWLYIEFLRLLSKLRD